VTNRRMFAGDPPRITFTKDFRQLVHGDLRPGSVVTLVYDADRLPDERSEVEGRKAWTIRAYYQFSEQGQIGTIDLWSETGEVLTKRSTEVGEGTMMTGRITIPADAESLTIWFVNTGSSGAEYWDSHFGQNYQFRFVVEDLEIDSVAMTRDPKGEAAQFQISVTAESEVSELAATYRVMNHDAPTAPLHRLPLAPLEQRTPADKRQWQGSAPVPPDAAVRFTLSYRIDGEIHTDTNSGYGYLTWPGAERNVEAGVL
jgi:hypothetical protein